MGLKLENSASLNNCSVASICSYLENGGSNSITGNANGCKSDVEVVAVCNGASSVDESLKSTVHIYPNPVSTELFIQHEKAIDKLELLDMFGRVVHESIGNPNGPIGVSHLHPGNYLIKIYSGEGRFTKIITVL
jgi:hypothetical protein